MRAASMFATAEAAEEAFYDAMQRGDLDAMMLNLAIVRDVAEIYGGSVTLEESEDLGGLLVKLRLPRAG